MNTLYEQKFIAQRSPLLSKNDYQKLFVEKNKFEYEDMLKLFDNPIIREGLLFASPNLYYAIKNKKGDNEKILNAFIKYYIRMTTRPTPFGLFSGIHFNSEYVKDKNTNIIHLCSVDFEWLVTFINHLELNIDILYGLKVIANKNLITEKNICTNPYISLRYTNKEYVENINVEQHVLSIENNQLIEYILNKCNEFIDFFDLINIIRDETKDNFPTYKIVNLLVNLINREFLYTNLRPSLPLVNPLKETINILDKIETADIYVQKLKKIDHLINIYNNTKIGEGEEILILLIEYMKKLHKSDKYIQIDMRLSDTNKKEIEHYVPNSANNFFKTSNYLTKVLNKNEIIENYTHRFIDKYGFERKVQLLEVVDSQKGIGYPEYSKNKRIILNNNEEKIKYMINNKIVKSIFDKKHSINISLSDLKKLKLDITEQNFGSFDLSFYKKDKLELSPLVGIGPSGRIIGRFLELAQISNNYTDIYTPTKTNNNIIDAELLIMPSKFRCGNIVTKQIFNKNQIVLGSYSKKESIKLQDIYISVTQNKKLYLYYHGKLLNIRVSNMLNTRLCPQIYRILLDISNQNSIPDSFTYIYSLIEKYNYVPQINIENVTVFPEKWLINKNILKMKKDTSFEEFLNLFRLYAKKYKIPKFFYLKDYDNTLLLYIDNLSHMKLLFSEINKNDSTFINLTYGGNNFNEISVDEIIMSYEPSNSDIIIPQLLNAPIENIDYSIRNNDLSSDWIYLKIYAKKLILKKIVINELNDYSNYLINKSYIDKYFYINYKDDKTHIRVRFHSITTHKQIYKEIINFILLLKNKYDIYDIKIDTYDRELERYGGINLMELNESIFHINSIISIKILQLTNDKDFSTEELVILQILYFLNKLNLSFSDIEKLFNFINNKDYLKSFRKNKSKYLNLYFLTINKVTVINSDSYNEILKIFHEQDILLDEFKNKLSRNKLTNSKNEIILSHLHMFCNRVFGIDRISEVKCYAIVKHLIHAIEGYKKYNG